MTLHNPNTGFFGRTYRGKQIDLKIDEALQELTHNEVDWAMFYTQSQAVETKAIVEIVIIETDSK